MNNIKLNVYLRCLIICFFIFQKQIIYSQNTEELPNAISNELDNKIESITEELNNNEIDFSNYYDEILNIKNKPININNVNESQLKLLQLNDNQIYNLKKYIETYGEITSIYELTLVEGFDSLTVINLQPFVIFNREQLTPKFSIKNALKYGKNSILLRFQQTIQQQKGYLPISDSMFNLKPNSRFLGTPERLFCKYSYNYYNKLRFGITMEKDPGEVFLKGPDTIKKGFDFYSFHIFYSGEKLIKSLALGDYNVSFGQGLTMSNSIFFNSNSTGLIERRMANGIRPSSSANEYLFLRGIATTLAISENSDLSLFYSNRKIDGNVSQNDTLSYEQLFINSLQQTGYHRTHNEYQNKNKIGQQVVGANLLLRIKMLKLGFTTANTTFDNEFKHSNDAFYKRFNFKGKSITNIGSDFTIFLNNLTLYGEISYSSNNAIAMISGFTAYLNHRLTISGSYRNYSKKYNNFFSNAFSENSINSNEKGLNIGSILSLTNKITISLYADNFKFPWLKYRVNSPSIGHRYTANIKYKISRYSEVLVSYKYKFSELNGANEIAYIKFPIPEERNNLRVQIQFTPLKQILFKSKIEFVENKSFRKPSKFGYLIYQDLKLAPENKDWSVYLRYSIFDTYSFNERIYSYENDMLYSFSVLPFYDKGRNFYVLFRYSPLKKVDIWLKYSILIYDNKDKISSGLTEINGNKKSEIKIQLRYKL